ncbi:hypothetical protein [Streptomyces globosus]|uniref:hypothetical protein n=1 Tax=Streptomyces globosus TaxID=68209 RepID=UPI0031DF4565
MTHALVHPGTARPQSLQNRPVRAARVRRAAVTVLSAVVRYSGIVFAAATTVFVVRATFNHDGPLVNLSAPQAVLAAFTLIGAIHVINSLAEGLIDWINPDRWDGDTAYSLAEELGDIHNDINSGADPDEIHHSLHTSGLLVMTGTVSRSLALAFAQRGEEDRAQRLYAAVLHLSKAADVFGYGQAGDEPADDARKDLQ